MSTRFKFLENQRKLIKQLLESAITKHVIDRYVETDQVKRKKELEQEIGTFVATTELDVHDLKTFGRYKIHPNTFSAQLAERFSTSFGINVTPTRENEFCQILLLCLECAAAIDEGVDVYRYAKAGIDSIKPKERANFDLLSSVERPIIEAVHGVEKMRKRAATLKRKTGGA